MVVILMPFVIKCYLKHVCVLLFSSSVKNDGKNVCVNKNNYLLDTGFSEFLQWKCLGCCFVEKTLTTIVLSCLVEDPPAPRWRIFNASVAHGFN